MALITVVASEVTGTSLKMPPNRPTGVRSGSQIRASLIRPAYPGSSRQRLRLIRGRGEADQRAKVPQEVSVVVVTEIEREPRPVLAPAPVEPCDGVVQSRA